MFLKRTPQECAAWLEGLLAPDRKPVGVYFLLTKEEYEEFSADEAPGRRTYCTFVRNASEGQHFKFHLGHMACMGGATALGLAKPGESTIDGSRRIPMECYLDLGVSRQITKGMVYCAHTPYGVAVVPLEDCEKEPHVVIFVGNAYHAMRITQGYAYRHGHIESISLSGMQAMCQECTSRPYETDTINFSMMCSGTRALARWKEEEMGIGMPYHLLETVIDGMIETVTPLERNKKKREIAARLEKLGLEDQVRIVMNKNYDDGCYQGGAPGNAGK